ncbi:MAG: glycine/betaine transporter substrate-binding protein [Mucilaginibacter sp.]|nr:glycine/betaine transporter substrate-binding protein [Mucilaginibacter sp.]
METIRLGQIALSFHRASAAYVSNILYHYGYKVSVKEAPHEAAFELLKNNEIDLLVSAWLPGSHGKYLASFEEDVIKLGTIYSPYCIWGVPEYMDASIINGVDDLRKPEITSIIDKNIFCINPGAGISRFSLEIIQQYKLNELGYTLTHLTEDEYFAYIEKSLEQKKQFVIPFWHPQFLHYKYQFRELKEPIGLLRSKDEATLLLRKDSLSKFDHQTVAMLKNIYLGNEQISALDYLLHIKKMNIGQALLYIKQNQS